VQDIKNDKLNLVPDKKELYKLSINAYKTGVLNMKNK